MTEQRFIDPESRHEDAGEVSIRPETLGDFVGQPQLRENLKVFIDAAKARGEAAKRQVRDTGHWREQRIIFEQDLSDAEHDYA